MRRYLPLRGIRVLSFEAAFSLPAATRVLSELGAEVVRVGRPNGDFPPFTHRTDGSAINKLSLSVDLQKDEGQALALQLCAAADVVCNNFRPKFMRGIGLTYERLRSLRPDIIVLQLSGYGTPGPWQDIGAFGPSVEAAGGMDKATGMPDDPPTKVGSTVFADQTAGRYAALAIVSALEQRRQTGRGRYIDLSMYEGIAHILGDMILTSARAGMPPPRRGNRSARHVPQGMYPCAGDDEWVAITVAGDAQWRALCSLLAEGQATNGRRGTALVDMRLAQRISREDEIDEAITAWTSKRTKEAVAETLQSQGIAAGPVQKVSDMPFDPQMKARGAFQMVTHAEPVLGYRGHPHLTLAWRTEASAPPPLEDARLEGQDNRTILKRWLGMTRSEIAGLEERGALLPPQLPPVEIGQRPRPNLDPDFAEKLGLEPAPESQA